MVWQHDLGDGEEVKRLRLISGVLDPTSQAQLANPDLHRTSRFADVRQFPEAARMWHMPQRNPER